ncbi:hypothetical protein LCGC14_0527500 [marine sediment metagenome]|uniref:Uncharacterized protein n=1 Tax=marine sediment metagenome TaxID=412755 RepID=A0A0F9S1C9_9ZZZZ
MTYLEQQLAVCKAEETFVRAYFDKWLPFANIGQSPEGILRKRYPLCHCKLTHKRHFSPYGGFWMSVHQCTECDYAHVRTSGD